MENSGLIKEYLPMERDYDYEVVCGAVDDSYLEYFKLPDECTGTQKDQGRVGACVAETITSIAEAWWNREFDIVDEHSEGFSYGAFRDEESNEVGLYVSTALAKWKSIGTLPKKYFDMLMEMPEMKGIVDAHPEFLEIAQKYRLTGYSRLRDTGRSSRDQQIKDALTKYKYGLVSVFGHHCVQLVGWDDAKDTYIYKDSYGAGVGDNGYKTKKKSSFSEVWLPIFTEITMPFEDVSEEDWFYDAAKRLYFAGMINGKTETTLAPNDYVTRAELFALLDRHISKEDEDRRILSRIINEKIDAKQKYFEE